MFWLATIKFFHCLCCSLSILYRLIYEVQPGVEASPQFFFSSFTNEWCDESTLYTFYSKDPLAVIR